MSLARRSIADQGRLEAGKRVHVMERAPIDDDAVRTGPAPGHDGEFDQRELVEIVLHCPQHMDELADHIGEVDVASEEVRALYVAAVVPARAAYSHSASVGNRYPSQSYTLETPFSDTVAERMPFCVLFMHAM